MPELLCNRCKQNLRPESAESFVIEVQIGERIVERLQFFDLHHACAKLSGEAELNKRAKKYRRRAGVDVRWQLVKSVT